MIGTFAIVLIFTMFKELYEVSIYQLDSLLISCNLGYLTLQIRQRTKHKIDNSPDARLCH